ncbi:MAG: FAD-dependent oxidoreductase [Thermoanaerobaculia bacterium]
MQSRTDLKRLPEAVAERERRPSDRQLSVAVVGAGLSGLACARTLADHGHQVQVFEKSRGAGGRMSTRRTDFGSFDHGAQYLTVRDRRFAPWIDSWLQEGLLARWSGGIVTLDVGRSQPTERKSDRFVGVPGMNAICRHLAVDLCVSFETRVQKLERRGAGWRLAAESGADLGRFDAVVVSAPAPQTADLLAEAAPKMAARAAEALMAPCWAAMASFSAPLELGFDGAFVLGSPLSWVARNASKPGRGGRESWVMHGSPDWSGQHLELEKEDAATQLLDAFRAAVGELDSMPIHLDAHRWRFALPQKPLPEPCLFDANLRLAACGDWCGGPRVEGAFLSGCAAAGSQLALRGARV